MRRVVVTGLGIISSIGHDQDQVTQSLKQGRSGIEFFPPYVDKGFRTAVQGSIHLELDKLIPRKIRRFMGESAAYSYLAVQQAIEDAELTRHDISNPRTGIVVGSGAASTEDTVKAAEILQQKGAKKIGAFAVPKAMASTNAACLAIPLQIQGVNYSISSACSTSTHCIGHGYELIQFGKQDIIFAGGGEAIHWTMTMLFDAMGALSSQYNHTPTLASRPYDVNRDGFVISGGGGILVLEELEHALARGADIYAEVVGYGASSDGYDMVQPSGEGAVRCMQQALATTSGTVDYINAHGTSTVVGDIKELEAIQQVFTDKIPAISSTKALTGHALGAAGVHESIYSLLMQKHRFIAPSKNIEQLDPEAENMPIIQEIQADIDLDCVMSNSFGFGGTNATLVFQRWHAN